MAFAVALGGSYKTRDGRRVNCVGFTTNKKPVFEEGSSGCVYTGHPIPEGYMAVGLGFNRESDVIALWVEKVRKEYTVTLWGHGDSITATVSTTGTVLSNPWKKLGTAKVEVVEGVFCDE
jgi:hypothetical protein